jgi:hypothetical protein
VFFPSSHDGYEIFIDDSSDWQQQVMESPYFFIHRGCLSFLCRHTNITPQTLTDSLFGSESPHRQWGAEGNLGLLKYVKYELMDQRYGQFFEYAISTLDTSTGQFWDDPESMSDMQWALARPTVFPLLRPTSSFGVMKRTPPASSSLARLITIPELLNAIIERVVEITDQELADRVLNHPSIHDATCLKLVTCTLLALSQVSSFFAMAILQECQGLFLRLARLYGWMLPVTPAEWASWPNARPLDLRLSTPFDWRAYVVTHLREEDPHARSRRRIYGMVTQFVKGTVDNDGRTWNVGKPNYRPDFEPPEPWGWEFADDELNDVDEVEEMVNMKEDEGVA